MSKHVVGIILVAALLTVAALAIGIDVVRHEGWAPIVAIGKAAAFVLLAGAWGILFVIGLQMAFTGTMAPHIAEVTP